MLAAPRVALHSCRQLLADLRAKGGMPWTDEERDRMAGLRSEARRQQFCAGRWLAKTLLAQALGGTAQGWRISAGADTKPQVIGHAGVHLSITHSGDFVACAIAHQPVGLDLERLGPQRSVLDMATLVCSPQEQAELRALPQAAVQAGFLAQWCRKEARLKQLGQPMDYEHLRGMVFVPAAAGDALVGTWRFDGAGLVLALAAPNLPGLQAQWLASGAPSHVEWHLYH